MGAEKYQSGNDTQEKSKPRLPSLLLGTALLLGLALLHSKINLAGEDIVPKLSPDAETRLQKRLKEIDDAEQYALVASIAGWYPCNHSGRTQFYLLPGEIWKYGTTTKGQFGRYSVVFFEEMNVFYLIQFRGTISECMKEEQRKLFFYPLLPENLARQKRKGFQGLPSIANCSRLVQ